MSEESPIKILLVNLPWNNKEQHGVRAGSRWPHFKEKAENIYLPFPFFLAYGTSLLKEHGFSARLLDAIAEDINEEQTADQIAEYAPTHVVVETSTITLENDLKFINSLSWKYKVVLVGPEHHIATEEFMRKNTRVDFSIQGEYEWALLELALATRDGTSFAAIGSLCFREKDAIVGTERRHPCDINKLPWPEREDVPLGKYHDTPGDIPQPSVQMMASRGCPFGCIFCLWPQVMYGGRSYRVRDYKDVADEMEYLVSKGFKSIYFDDDTFGLNKKWVLDLCNEIMKRNGEGRLNVPWAMMTRADAMDKEMLIKMRAAGLMAVKYGVETASPDLLKVSGKEYDRRVLEEMIEQTKALGIKVHLTFTFGLPGESERSANDTIFYAFHLAPDSVQFSVTTPFPGTEYYEQAKKDGSLISEDWSQYDGNYHSVIRTDSLEPRELVALKDKAYYLWGIFDRARHMHRLIYQVSKIYLYMHVLGGAGMLEKLRVYIKNKMLVTKELFKFGEWLKTPFKKRIHDRLTYLGIFHGERAFAGPQLIQIDLTNDCNNDCIGCWCNSPLLEEKMLPPEEKMKHIPLPHVLDLIDDAFNMGTTEVYLAGGGEPFMYPHIMDVIRHIKQKGMILYINTNFTLVDIPRIQEIVHLGVDHFTVSIWAGTPATYSATHPNKGEETFHHLENMLKYLQSLKQPANRPPYVKVYHVISKLNYQEIDAMYEFVLRTKSESVEFTVLDTIPGKTDVLMLDAEEMAVLREQAEQLKTRVSQLKSQGLNPPLLFRFDQFQRRISDDDCVDGNYDKNIIDSIPCYVGWIFSRIIPDGHVNGCLKGHRVPLGNVNEARFRDIWNSEAQRYFRKKTYAKEKTDDFFSLIGNDPRAKVGCHKGCDDLGRNQHTHQAIESLMWPEKVFWKACARIIRGISHVRYAKWRNRNHYEFNTKRALALCDESLASTGDPELRGIEDKYRAFKGPSHVVVDLTNRCGNSCLGCWMYSPYLPEDTVDKKWLQQELSRKDTMKLIADLASMGTEIIRFTGGGEPLLHKDFSAIVHYAKKKGLRVAVTTCLPPGSHKCKEALSLVDELAVSIWAGDAETYVDLHPNQSLEHFHYITELIKELKGDGAAGLQLTTCHVLTNKNVRVLDTMIAHAREVKADAIYFALVDPIEGGTDKLLLSDDDHAWLREKMNSYEHGCVDGLPIENYDGICARLNNTRDAAKGHYDKEHIDSMPCYIGWHFSRILADGNVVPCCRGVKKVMGNIRKQRFKKIWHGKTQEEFRNNALLLSKFDQYFKDIQCFKTCDNWMHNKLIHERRFSKGVNG